MKKLLTVVCLRTSLQVQQSFAGTLAWTSPISISSPCVNASHPQIVIGINGKATYFSPESHLIKTSQLPAGENWRTITTISNSGASISRWRAETATSSTGASGLARHVEAADA